MNDRKTKRLNYILIAVFLLICILFIRNKKNSHDAYGYCVVTEAGENSFGYSRLVYEYEVAGKKYEYVENKNTINNIIEGERYVITYSSKCPENNNPLFLVTYCCQSQLDSLLVSTPPGEIGSVWTFDPNNAKLKRD